MTNPARTSSSVPSRVTTSWACTARSPSSSPGALNNPPGGAACSRGAKGNGTSAMQNSPGIPLAAFVVAIVLAGATIFSVMAGVGGDPALNELQIGAAAWAVTLGMCGAQGIVSIVLEGRQLFVGAIAPRLTNPLSAAIAACSMLLLILAGLTGLAIVSGQPTAVVGTAAGAGCFDLGLLLLLFKAGFVGHEAHLEPRHDGVPW